MKRLFIVTGANGFLGNNIIRQLEQNPENEIRALVLPNDKVHSLEGLRCQIYYGDVTKKETLQEIFSNLEDRELFVIHCAAIVYIKMVYVSSVHALPEKPNREVITEITDFDPEKVKGEYAKTKAETAAYVLKMVKEKNLNACIVHPSGIIGPYDFGCSHLTQLMIDFANGRLKACVNGGYDFVDVRDVADGVIRACDLGRPGECYILSNRYVPVKELLDTVSEVRHTKKIRTVLPMWLAKLTAPLSEIYYAILKQPPLYTRYSLYTLTSNSNFSNEKAKRELGYQNRDFHQTIADTIAWLEEHHRIHS